MKTKHLLTALKVVAPIVIVGWLLSRIKPDDWAALRERDKDWWRLTGALVAAATAVSITFVRWYLLVRALDLKFRLFDAFRLGFRGFLLQFVSMGSVGGDLFKAVFIAVEQPGRRTESVATVVVDRVVGMFGLLVLASTAILLNGFPDDAKLLLLCRVTLGCTAIATAGLVVVMWPGFATSPLWETLTRIPRVGGLIQKLVGALAVYGRARLAIFVAIGTAVFSHGLFAVAIYLLASGLYDSAPTLASHFVIGPLALTANAIPLMPAGLGQMELAMDFLYGVQQVSDDGGRVSGVTIAIAYRMVTILVALMGVPAYWTKARRASD